MSWRNEIRKLEIPEYARELMKTQKIILRIMNGYTKLIDESLDKEELDKTVRALIGQLEGQI